MKELVLSLPTFGFIVSTRAALGVGIGLIAAENLPANRRRLIGAALVTIGAATTVPAAISVIKSLRRSRRRSPASVEQDERLVGATRFPRKGDDVF
ncbi:MAG: hypothetical protein DMG01_16425 [Acidobacteria bacterium]|nr:MAG: hypothetical protein DMG01_16425 [Acidobacteriota bacterium]